MKRSSAELVKRFNKSFPVGSKVWWQGWGNNGDHKQYTVRTEAFIAENNEPVVFLTEKSGYVSVDTKFVDYTRKEKI